MLLFIQHQPGCNKSWRLQAAPTTYCAHNTKQALYIVVWDGQYTTFVTAPWITSCPLFLQAIMALSMTFVKLRHFLF